MAKKKSSKAKEPEEENKDQKDDLVTDEELESQLLGSSEKISEDISPAEPITTEEEVKKPKKPRVKDEQIEFKPASSEPEPISELAPTKKEPEIIKKDYKYLKASLISHTGNIFKIQIEGESHSLLNNLCNNLLKIKGIEYAAYKETSIEPAVLTIITDGSIDLRKTLKATTSEMKKEFIELKKLVSKSIKQ